MESTAFRRLRLFNDPVAMLLRAINCFVSAWSLGSYLHGGRLDSSDERSALRTRLILRTIWPIRADGNDIISTRFADFPTRSCDSFPLLENPVNYLSKDRSI